jgi:hypothetical protein
MVPGREGWGKWLEWGACRWKGQKCKSLGEPGAWATGAPVAHAPGSPKSHFTIFAMSAVIFAMSFSVILPLPKV